MAAWSAPVSGPSARAATTVTAVSEAPCSGEASWAARSLGALAGRNDVLSLCVTFDSDGSSTMAAIVPATQASTIAQRKRTASRPATAKGVLTETIVAGQRVKRLGLTVIVVGGRRKMLDRRERKVASWQIRTATGRRRARFPSLPGSTGSVTSAAG